MSVTEGGALVSVTRGLSLGWGRRSCRRAGRGRGSRGAGRARRAVGRTRRSRPDTAGGTPRRRADRAVPLAQLQAREGSGRHRAGRRGIPIAGEHADERVGARDGVVAQWSELRGIPALGIGGAAAREGLHRRRPDRLTQVAQSLRCEVVVIAGQRVVAGRGQDPVTGRAATPTTGRTAGLTLDDGTRCGKRIEMAADSGRSQRDHHPERRRSHRAVLGHRGEHSRAGARFGIRQRVLDIHHTSMS
jgi:hypothetical protein